MKLIKTKKDSPSEATESGADRVFRQIHEAVLDHRLAPGTKLKEIPLAELFGVTRGTVRKALQRLAEMKLIELRPNRGAVVASPSAKESRDLFGARRAVESAIVDTVARNISPLQMRKLRTHLKNENLAYKRGETQVALKLSVDFHRIVAQMAGNSVLAEMLDQLVARTPLVLLNFADPAATDNSCANDDHALLVDAIEAGDADKSVRIMHRHLCALESRLVFHREAPDNTLAALFGLDQPQQTVRPTMTAMRKTKR